MAEVTGDDCTVPEFIDCKIPGCAREAIVDGMCGGHWSVRADLRKG